MLSFVVSFTWGTQRIYIQVHDKQNKILAIILLFFLLNLIVLFNFIALTILSRKFTGCEESTFTTNSYRPFPEPIRLYCPILFSKFAAKRYVSLNRTWAQAFTLIPIELFKAFTQKKLQSIYLHPRWKIGKVLTKLRFKFCGRYPFLSKLAQLRMHL